MNDVSQFNWVLIKKGQFVIILPQFEGGLFPKMKS